MNGAGEAGTRAAPVAVVLQAAAHHVRLLHVVVDVVELREREGVHHLEGPASVEAQLPAAVGAADDALGVERIDPKGLMVAMYGSAYGAEVQAAVLGFVQRAGEREPLRRPRRRRRRCLPHPPPKARPKGIRSLFAPRSVW